MQSTKLFLASIFILPLCLFSQDIDGVWKGELEVSNTTLEIVFNIEKSGDNYSSTMDSPSQNTYGIPVNHTIVEDSLLTLKIDKPKVSFKGKRIGATMIKGNFEQGSLSIPLELIKSVPDKKEKLRPQEPLEPFPYISEEVTFKNQKAKINLKGTLTKPMNNKASAVVILLSGSGPQNRDEEAFGHKPFLVISDYLTKNGIAVLRYDDRGTEDSEGDYKSASLYDFASDAVSAITYIKSLKEFEHIKIGIIGHSEGGTIAPIVAKQSNDLDFIISLAGTALAGDEILLIQQRLGGIEAGADEDILEKSRNINIGAYDLIKKYKNNNVLRTKLTDYITQTLNDTNSGMSENKKSAFASKQVNKLSSPWMTSFIRYNPERDLSKLKIPYFALFGELDTQVTPEENIQLLLQLKKVQNHINIIEFKGVNHLFQECKTGSPTEYTKINQTISPMVLDSIFDIIFKQISRL